MVERLLEMEGHGFRFEVPNRRLELPESIRRQVGIQASIQLEETLAQQLNHVHRSVSEYPGWARPSFRLTDPASHAVLDENTSRLYSEAKKESGFVAKWGYLDQSKFPSNRSVQALKLLLKRHYPDFLKSNALSDSKPAVNAFSLLVLKEYQTHVHDLIQKQVAPHVEPLKTYSSFPDPRHAFLEGLSEGFHLNLPAISFSDHAGFENPFVQFLESYKHLVILSGSEPGRQFYQKWGKDSEAEAFKSAVRMREKLEPIGLL